MWLYLVYIQAGVADKDKGSGSEVENMYGVGIVLLKLADRGVAAGGDMVIDCSKISWAFLKLAGMGGKKALGQKLLGKIRNEEGSLHEVKRKEGFHTMCHEEGGVAS